MDLLDEAFDDAMLDKESVFSSPSSPSPMKNEYDDLSFSNSNITNDPILFEMNSYHDYYTLGSVIDSINTHDGFNTLNIKSENKEPKNNQKGKKRPRTNTKSWGKKKRKLSDSDVNILKITLSRDELLTFTSKQFEEYVQKIETDRSLSSEEKKRT